MSAFTPIASKHWQRSETTRCANRQHWFERKRPPTEAALDYLAQPINGVGQSAIDIRLAH
jgi:hypothetical protein